MENIIAKIVEASPYLGFILLFMWFESKREDKRIENAAILETRREVHEKAMQERILQHDREINTLWAGYIQQIVEEIKVGNRTLLGKLDEHEEDNKERYKRMEITMNLFKAASGKGKL